MDLIQFMLKYGYWSIPNYHSLAELQRFESGKNVLSMELAANIIKLAREIGDQSITDFIYQYYLKNMRTPEASMSVDLAIELVKMSRERGDQYMF